MKKKYIYHFLKIFAVCIILYLIVRVFFISPVKPKTVTAVTVSPVVQQSITIQLKTIGTVEAYSSVDVKSLVTGQLLRTDFKEGDIVQQNQVLFEIDPRPFQAALDQAKAELARNTATLVNNQLQLKRNQPLSKKGFVSKQDYDTLQATVQASFALVQENTAAVENAKLQLEYTTIRAPIPGKTGNILLKTGSIIKANDTNPLVTIRQINPIYITFSIPQTQLNLVELRANAPKIKATVNGKYTTEGTLSFIDNSVDAATGNIQMKATFENKELILWPGQYVRVQFPVERMNNAILIPSLAMLTGQKGFYVFVVDAQSVAHLRIVDPGPVVGANVVVRSGLKPGEQVVTAGQLRVNDGEKVEIHG